MHRALFLIELEFKKIYIYLVFLAKVVFKSVTCLPFWLKLSSNLLFVYLSGRMLFSSLLFVYISGKSCLLTCYLFTFLVKVVF